MLINLLTNAIRYGNRKPIEVEVRRNGTHACLIVRDQGMGIKEMDHERIFQHFVRANSVNGPGGLGLGLYISDSIVRMHGGKIKLKSEEGKGSEFTVLLPLEPGPSGAP